MKSQTEQRKVIEKEGENITNKRLQELAKKSQNNPQTPYGKQEK